MNSLKKILLVDDDVDDQEFFIEALTGIENTHLFGIANNGIEALKSLDNVNALPDYIFLDFNMPLMNGVECLMNIRTQTVTKDIPVFMLSSAIEQAELSRTLGAKGFIKKSADIYELHTQLDRIINENIIVNYVTAGETCVKQHSSFCPRQ